MAQVNKISSFKSFTEVKSQEATMKLRETNNAKRQETVGKIGAILDEMGLTSLSELDEVKKQALINKMFGNVSEDEAEDIEDELNKLGEPKKLEERNAFLGARAKAIEEDKNEFEFNGKKYKVTVNEGNAFGDAVRKAKEAGEKEFEFDGKTYKVEEGNAFGDAVRKAKEDGEKEFEFDGKTFKVEEAKRTKFTGKVAHDLYTQTGGKPVEVFVKNDWYSVDPKELKDDKGEYFTGYSKDGSDYDFYLKDIDFIQESLNEGRVKAAALLQELIDGNTSRAEGIKMSKDLAEHYLYWLKTSPYGKKNTDLPLYMLIKSSFFWGIERGLDPKLKVELEALKAAQMKNESVEFISEARTIAKIQYDWSKLTTTMQATAQNWKVAEGPAKEMLLGKLKEMTAQKNALETELDAAIADKDKDIELVITEAFFRLPKDVIGNELYAATQNLANLYGSILAGNDVDAGVIDTVIKALTTVKKSVKKFNSKEEVLGTVYEGKAKDLKPNHKYTSDYGEVTFIKLNPDGKTMKLHSKETGEIKTDISNAYNMELIESVVNEAETVKSEAISRLADFFRISPNALSKFNFDGKDNIKELTKVLNSTSDQGTELYYNTAINAAKKDLGIKESVVNEAEKFKSTQDFEEFLEEIDGMPEVRIKRIMGKDYIDTPGGFRDEAEDYDNDIVEYTLSNMGRKDFEALKAWWENNVQESTVNEADMTKFYDGFKVLNDKTGEMTKFKYIKGTKNQNVENEAIAKLMKATGLTRANFGVHGFVKKGEWNMDKTPVLESLTEGMISPKMANGFKIGNKIKTQKGTYTITGFGQKTGATRDFEAENENGEQFNLRVSLRGATGIQVAAGARNLNFPEQQEMLESVVTEGAAKQFDVDFTMMVKNIKSGYGWIDPEYVADTWENSSTSIDFELVKGEIYKRLIAAGLLAYADDEDEEVAGKYVKSIKELGIKESVVNEAEVKSDDEFKEYAMTVLKKAFGDDFDEAKATEVVDGILKKCGDDYGACVGMITASLGESVVTEAFDANYWEDYQEGAEKMKNPSGMQIMQDVQAAVEDWNDNNEMGEENEVTPAGEKKVLKLAKEFVKAKGWISFDIIDAMIAQES